jgi:hypothetical protein
MWNIIDELIGSEIMIDSGKWRHKKVTKDLMNLKPV